VKGLLKQTYTYPVGKIARKAACRSVFWRYGTVFLSAELTKTRYFFGDFAHWVEAMYTVMKILW